MNYTLRPRARTELEGIWHYTVQQWGIDQADKYTAQIISSIERAIEMPGVGSPIEALPKDYRKIRSGHHLIVYRCVDNEFTVIRILHEREDLPDELDA